MSCNHLHDRKCALGLYGGKPSPGICNKCDKYEGPARGAGDVVHTVVKALRLDRVADRVTRGRDCGCSERRRRWNKTK